MSLWKIRQTTDHQLEPSQGIGRTSHIKTESGKELWQLHDVVNHHVHSLKTINGDMFEAFLSTFIKRRLDQESKFAWQEHTHEKEDVPSINKFLEFINWRAQVSEHSASSNITSGKQGWVRTIIKVSEGGSFTQLVKEVNKTRASYQIITEWKCVGYNEAAHLWCYSFMACGVSVFQSLNPEEQLAKARKHSLCMNYLHEGHFASQCQSMQRCNTVGSQSSE